MCTTIQKSGIFCEESSCSCSNACRSVSMFSQKAAPDGLNALSFTFLSLSPISSFLRTRRLVIMESAPLMHQQINHACAHSYMVWSSIWHKVFAFKCWFLGERVGWGSWFICGSGFLLEFFDLRFLIYFCKHPVVLCLQSHSFAEEEMLLLFSICV